MRATLVTLAVLLLAAVAVPAAAQAEFGLVPGGFHAETLDAAGKPELRAGAHPYVLRTGFEFIHGEDSVDADLRDLTIDLPTGLAGDASAVPTCPQSDFTQLSFSGADCPPEAQIGVLKASFFGLGDQTEIPIYNLEPRDGEAAEFGATLFVVAIRMIATVRADGDFGTRITIRDQSQAVAMLSSEIEFWGVPADHQTGTTTPRRPFLTNATRCDQGPPTMVLRARSWQDPDHWATESSSAPTGLTGCGDVPFEAGLDVRFDSSSADTPSGMQTDVTLPQNDDPSGRAMSHLKRVEIVLPPGVALSPGVADGLQGCDDGQLGVGGPPTACPDESKIGTVEIVGGGLAEPLRGGIYLGTPVAGDPFRLFVVANGPGFTAKLRGSLLLDTSSGRMTAVLSDLPQLSFSRLSLRFKGGPRAAIVTPPGCGTGNAEARLTPYRGAPVVTVVSPVRMTSGPGGAPCVVQAPFGPSFEAGSSPAVSGRATSFSAVFRRPDGHEWLDRLQVSMPPGLMARMSGVGRCSMAVAAVAACPSNSRVGSVTVEAGAGSRPLRFSGGVFLTGPYRDAPFGLALVMHVAVGPLDFGTLALPVALRLDPLDGHVTIASDELPTMVAGVPLRLRTVAIDMDRPGFMVTPTSCRVTRVSATVRGVFGSVSQSGTRYGLQGCKTLAFGPALSVALTGARQLRRGGHPVVTIGVRARAGSANMRSIVVGLPAQLGIDQNAVTTICSRVKARDGACPVGSSVGSARVVTPLFPAPLTGSVYVVRPESGTLPDLWVNVRGSGISMNLRSTTSWSVGKPVRATFVDLPDVPMSSFTLQLRGGGRGMLALAKDLCSRGRAVRLTASGSMLGHNGKRRSGRVRVQARPRCTR